MSKLNPRGQNVTTNIVAVAAKRMQSLVTSANGNLQFKKENEQQLYELVVASLFSKGNELNTASDIVNRVKENVRLIVQSGNYDFIANLAIHSRIDMNIRTIPLVMVVHFAAELQKIRYQAINPLVEQMKNANLTTRQHNRLIDQIRNFEKQYNYSNMRQLVCDVIQRADQLTDIYAYALTVFGDKKKIPIAIKRGVADAFNKFDQYQFSKYNRAGAVKLSDVIRIVHPKPNSAEQGKLFEQIIKDTLTPAYTWERTLAENGQRSPAEKRSNEDLWTELLENEALGFTAMLRNLRNIVQAGVDQTVIDRHIVSVLTNAKRVERSKQLPQDFREAYNIVANLRNQQLTTALSKAIDHSVNNIPDIGKKVWLIVDYSGSMGEGEDSAFGNGVFLAASLLKGSAEKSNVAVTLFGSAATTLQGLDVNQSVIGLIDTLKRKRTGSIAGSTDFHAALREYKNLPFTPDTIIVITDGEVNRFPYQEITNIKAPVKIAVNMSASLSTPMTQHDQWYSLAGWSTVLFRWIPLIREKVSAVEALSGPYRSIAERALA